MHVILDLYGCKEETLREKSVVERRLKEIVNKIKLKPIHSYFHQFEPFGVTGFILLKESHISIHTWPENEYAAIDIFSCREIENVQSIIEMLKNSFLSTKEKVKIIKRI